MQQGHTLCTETGGQDGRLAGSSTKSLLLGITSFMLHKGEVKASRLRPAGPDRAPVSGWCGERETHGRGDRKKRERPPDDNRSERASPIGSGRTPPCRATAVRWRAGSTGITRPTRSTSLTSPSATHFEGTPARCGCPTPLSVRGHTACRPLREATTPTPAVIAA